MTSGFTHLHLHTQYSLLDGAIRIADLPGALQTRGFDACAVTDHGNMFGAVEFHNTLRKAGLKPIIGMEAYVADGTRTTRGYQRPGPNARHLVLLCQDREGYENLMRLASLGYLEGRYYGVPRIDRELLEQYNRGLIATTACLGGMVNRPLLRGEVDEARESARWLGQVFDGRCYLEIQQHGLEDEHRANAALVKMAAELDLPLVGTNDCHYLNPEEAEPHYLLQLIGWQKKLTDPNTEPFSDKHLYLKTPDEMRAALADFAPEVYENAGRIADMCELDLSCSTFYLPQYDIPPEFSEQEWFRKESHEGLERRLEVLIPRYGISDEEREAFRAKYIERLDFEIDVINSMKYAGYFLIVADFIIWAKDHPEDPVRVGPGRGSGAGSLVAYAMRITDLDPIHHGLLFERFLNPERVSLPDFDIDFDVEGRERVIAYVRGKYGEDRVCQISTFGSLGAKAALRNVARVLDFPYSQADKIAKLIPNKLGITLQQSIAMEPELARLEREGDEGERKLIRCSKALEGLNSNLSTHAAGVIIMDTDIQKVMPVCVPTNGEGLQSQYSMKWAEDQGAVKFDFLGLLNLTIIKKAVALIEDVRGADQPVLDIDNLALDDTETFRLLSRGDTTGVFQLESGGMRRLLTDLKPSCFEDIVAILALYRPGPLDSGMTESFVRRKNGREPVDSLHPKLEHLLRETYGVMAYQEQVMEAARILAGYSLGEADLLRRAMGKKDEALMAQQREQFVVRCVEREIAADTAEGIFNKINNFAGYGFNKSHSAAYALVAYQTAYLKAHHPVEFMAALLSSDMDKTDKVVSFIADCRDMGVTVLPPDVNRSASDFTIDGRSVRFGLSAVKNVGVNAVEVILEARSQQPGGRFADLAAFMSSVDLHRVNKRVLEALIRCGGFDSLHPNRAELLAGLDAMTQMGLAHQRNQVQGQENLFDLMGQEGQEAQELRVDLPTAQDFHPRLRLKLEKEALGFYISGHPLNRYRSEVGHMAASTHALREGEFADNAEVSLAGMVGSLTVRMTKNAEKWALLRMEDLRGSVEVIVYAKVYAEVAELLKEDEPLLIRGRVRVREEEVSVLANQVLSLSQYRADSARKLTINVAPHAHEAELPRLVGVLAKSEGDCSVGFAVHTEDGSRVVIDSGMSIRPTESFMVELEELLSGSELQFRYPREQYIPGGRGGSNGGGGSSGGRGETGHGYARGKGSNGGNGGSRGRAGGASRQPSAQA